MEVLQACLHYGSRSVILASRLLSRPCQGVLAQRAERTTQLWCLYSKLYDRHAARRVLTRLGSSFQRKVSPKSRSLLLLLSASVPVIKLDKSSVASDGTIDEMLMQAVHTLWDDKSSDSRLIKEKLLGRSSNIMMDQSTVVRSDENMEWELFVDGEAVTVWRRPVVNKPSHLCEYLVYGSYCDIKPIAFHVAQTDIEYRRKWDSYTSDLKLLRSDTKSKTEFIQWVVSFPFPLAPREYILRRQSKVDFDKSIIVATNKAVEPERDKDLQLEVPGSSRVVRVADYYSVMVVVPHTSLEEPGLDFVLFYFDDPQMPSAKVARCAQSIGAGTGMRDYLTRLRKAALGLQEDTPRLKAVRCQDSNGSARPEVEGHMSKLGALSA